MTWTKDKPKHKGFYFYHDPADGDRGIVEYDTDAVSEFFFMGSDRGYTTDDLTNYEFWTERIKEPPR